MQDITTQSTAKQAAGGVLILAVVIAVLYYAGGFGMLADHLTIAADAGVEQYEETKGYLSSWMGDKPEGSVVADAANDAEKAVANTIDKKGN